MSATDPITEILDVLEEVAATHFDAGVSGDDNAPPAFSPAWLDAEDQTPTEIGHRRNSALRIAAARTRAREILQKYGREW